MIYLVTRNQELFDVHSYQIIDVDTSLNILNKIDTPGVDSETNGRDPHINKVLCLQIGNKDNQVVIDASTVDLKLYKEYLESKFLIFQNGKFDLQFLYNYGIKPLRVYDTMIVEQFLHLGYPPGVISYSLKSIAEKRLGIEIDKSVRGEIIWRGLDEKVINYAALDVVYLEDIMKSQLKDVDKIPNGRVGAKIECDFTPVIAYLEWCGIKLDENKWKAKMKKDKENYDKALKELNAFLVETPSLKKFWRVDKQGNLFEGFNDEPIIYINWSSSQQVTQVAKILGFNTTVQDKKTGEDKDSVLEKTLKCQKGINDEFLELYFKYQEYAKVVTSFGRGHLNAINPITGRLHTTFKAIGAASGRMACGSNQPNTDLAKYKHISPNSCKYPNIQQLPADKDTRSSFVAEKGNLLVDCDFSALESRLGADIYNEKCMQDEYNFGSGDIHSLMAITFFEDKMRKGITTKEVKKEFPQLRKEAKSPEFLIQFGGSAFGLAQQLGCSLEKAEGFVDKYYSKFSGIAEFKKKGSENVKKYGYVEICKATGHRMYWWDFNKWKKDRESFTPEFWEAYRQNHKGTGDSVCQKVKEHFRASSKWDRMALNGPTQGCGAIILKTAATDLYKWIINNNLFNKVKFCAFVHDEILAEFPKKLSEFPKILEETMFNAAAKFCKSVPIPAEAEVGNCWIH